MMGYCDGVSPFYSLSIYHLVLNPLDYQDPYIIPSITNSARYD